WRVRRVADTGPACRTAAGGSAGARCSWAARRRPWARGCSRATSCGTCGGGRRGSRGRASRGPWTSLARSEVAASEANWRRADRRGLRRDRVVIHVVQAAIVALKVFKDPAHGAAAHYVVRRDGHLAQTIRELDVAFHAGNRSFNERSIGIEHEGWIDRPQDFTDAMLRASARLTASICARYGFPPDREHIIGHVEVPGADHIDPGRSWPWEKYMRMVRQARTEVEGTKAAARMV
ncbi:LOW QUALITY PROTEIN: N-acetylmuramoyl-L-alanine amidase, partial [Streptomyces sp. SPB78]